MHSRPGLTFPSGTSMRLLVLAALLIPFTEAPGAQPTQEVEAIESLMVKADCESVRKAVDLIKQATLPDAERISLLGRSLELAFALPTGMNEDAVRLCFLDASSLTNLGVPEQTEIIKYWAKKCETEKRGTRSSVAWNDFRIHAGIAMIEWCAAIEATRDPNFDRNNLPQLNTIPPKGAHISPGTDPAQIADPEMRKQYEASIKTNVDYTVYYRKQIKLEMQIELAADAIKSWSETVVDAEAEVEQPLRAAASRLLTNRIAALIFSTQPAGQ